METTTSTTSQAMRILVGLPSKKGAYHLPRDVDVPKELRVIWFSLGPTTRNRFLLRVRVEMDRLIIFSQ